MMLLMEMQSLCVKRTHDQILWITILNQFHEALDHFQAVVAITTELCFAL